MACVSINNLTKNYAEKSGASVMAVKGINLTIADREFMVLVGPSGCGKSTTLRMIAGLEEISGGTIAIDGQVVNDILPKDRDIAMVFQNYALYPHMSVYENMAFGLTLRKFSKSEIDARVRAAARMLNIEQFLDRKPKALSGGQRQRVAVGRAIVRKPKVFLFDEPLSNLDAKMRVSTRTEIAKLHSRLEATMIYVTHDQVEAMTMGDRICVMKDGEIMQVASPLELYNRPVNMFVAGFIGSPPMNFFRGTVGRTQDALRFVEENPHVGGVSVELGDEMAARAAGYVGKKIVLGIRAEDITDAFLGSGYASVTANIEVLEPMGAETYVYLHTGATPFIARMAPAFSRAVGQSATLYFNRARVHLFDPLTEQALSG